MKIADIILMHHVHSVNNGTARPETTAAGIRKLIYVVEIVFGFIGLSISIFFLSSL